MMKKRSFLLMFLVTRLCPICCWGLVVGLTFAVRAAGGELTPITLKHDAGVNSVAFSPDGKLLATGSYDKTAKVWEMPSGRLIATLKHDNWVNSVTFSPDGKLLATGSHDNTAKVWEMPSGVLIATLKHNDYVNEVAFSPDGTLLATRSDDLIKHIYEVKVWEMPSGKLLATLKHDDWVRFTFSPDGMLLATTTSVSLQLKIYEAKVWEMPSGKLLATLKHNGPIESITFSPDGTLLATGSSDYTAKVWEMPSGVLLATLKHDWYVNSVAFSPDGMLLATGADDKTAKVWEMPSGVLLATLKHDWHVESVIFSPNGTLLVTWQNNSNLKMYEAKVWNIPSGRLLATLKHEDYVDSVIFSPDGKLLATRSADKTAKVWEMPSGRLLATLKHNASVDSVAFSPDGTLLATAGSFDNTAKVWAPNTADIPTLTQPPDGSQFVDALPGLGWGKVPNATYQVQIAKDKNFSQMAVEASTGAESLKIGTEQLAVGTYFWRVRTVGWVDFGKWSEVWTFNLIGPIAPALSAPADGAAFVDTLTPTLKWQASLNTTAYGIQIAKDDKFSVVVIERTKIAQTEYPVPAGKLAPGPYWWRVNATGVIGTGDWSQARSMSLKAPNVVMADPIAIQVTKTQLEVETTPPPPPEVDLPILLQDARKLYGFQLDIGFNPAILEVLNVTEGDLLKSIGGTTFWKPPTIDNRAGMVKGMLSARKDPGEVNGNGTLAVLHLRIKQPSSSPIEFSNIKLSNEAVEPLPATWVNSSVSYTLTVTPTPKPVASATIRAIPAVVNNEIVVSVRMEGANQLNGFSAVLRYPSSELELLEVKKGDFFTAELKQPSGNPMQLEAKKSDSKASVTGGGELLSLRFRIWEGGEMTFGLGQGTLTAPILLPSQKQGEVSTPTLENGRITVVASPEWDVNKDYVVNIFDLVLLAQNFGKSITGTPRPNPDVARDGSVDVFDFVKVGINFGKQYSALPPAAAPPLAREPMPVERTVPPSERASLLRVLSALESARHPDAEFRQVMELLRSLLGLSMPERTRLLSNFPNPFNPETWIPYQLAQPSEVAIRIWDVQGRLVRTLELGYRPAGYYLNRERAAYWDGRNEAGEWVASGMYFYQLRTDDFTAVKRMVIRK